MKLTPTVTHVMIDLHEGVFVEDLMTQQDGLKDLKNKSLSF